MSFRSVIPEGVIRQIEGSIYMADYQNDALDRAERNLGIHRKHQDRAQVRARWTAAWARSRRVATRVVIEEAINFVLHNDHIGRLTVDMRFQKLPKDLRHPCVEAGVLTVKDAPRTTGSIYLRSYLEVTPAELFVRTVHVAGGHRQRLGLQTSYPFPLCWDPTDGSGTGRKVVGAMGGQVVCSDLTPHFACIALDVRKLGETMRHRLPFLRRARTDDEKLALPLGTEALSISRPHIIFLDPPSIGHPTHQKLYGGGVPAPDHVGHDLADLHRNTWNEVVAGTVAVAFEHLAEGGVVGLTLREGRRERENVFPEVGVADSVVELVRGLVPHLVVLDDIRVVYDPVSVCQQRSLGLSRLPMRHLVLARAA